MGYPVALLARAELRERREFSSITRNSSLFGSSANWMLHSPIIPRARTTLKEAILRMWYSLFVRVWEGATTMLSPV